MDGEGILGVWDTADSGSFVKLLGATHCHPLTTIGRRWSRTYRGRGENGDDWQRFLEGRERIGELWGGFMWL